MSMATFEHASNLYDVFNEHAISEEHEGIPLRVFKGSIVEAYKSIGASQVFYSDVMDTLKDQGCITILSSGRRARPSVIALHYPPDEIEFIIQRESGLTNSPEAAKLRVRLENLEKRVGGVNIADTLIELDKRVSGIERQLEKALSFINTQNTSRKETQ